MTAATLANRRAAAAGSLIPASRGTSTADTAPPIATSSSVLGTRVAISNASAWAVAPKTAAMTGSRTNPSRRERTLPAATRPTAARSPVKRASAAMRAS